jgi:hypothetical protein
MAFCSLAHNRDFHNRAREVGAAMLLATGLPAQNCCVNGRGIDASKIQDGSAAGPPGKISERPPGEAANTMLNTIERTRKNLERLEAIATVLADLIGPLDSGDARAAESHKGELRELLEDADLIEAAAA